MWPYLTTEDEKERKANIWEEEAKSNLNELKGEPIVWSLTCRETSGVESKEVSRPRPRLWRDRQELAGRLRCHIHQRWPSGTGCSVAKKKLHISEYVYVDTCSGSRSLNPYWHVELNTRYSITGSDALGTTGTAMHFVVEKAIKAIIGTKLFLWCAIRIFFFKLRVWGRRRKWGLVSSLISSDMGLNWTGLHILHFPSYTRGMRKMIIL